MQHIRRLPQNSGRNIAYADSIPVTYSRTTPNAYWIEFAVAFEPRELAAALLAFVQRGIYVVPCLLLVTLAHWLLRRDGSSSGRWRRCGIHWMTWLAFGVMAVSVLHHAMLAHTGYFYIPCESGCGAFSVNSYGWPLKYTANYGHTNPLWAITAGTPIAQFTAHALLVNLVVAAALIVGTAFLVERWIRRTQQHAPMARGTLLAAFTAAALVAHILSVDHSFRPAWYVYPFWLCGMFSAIFTIMALVARGWVALVSRVSSKGGAP